MRSFLVMFLVAIIIMTKQFAQALNCHVCTANENDCSNPMQCPGLAIYCKTIRASSPALVYKSCAAICTKDSMEEIQIKQNAKVSCCQSDLCNGAASWNPGSSSLILTGLLSIFWGLFALGL
ncbi:ly-6/neurotoxin-like protein 1 [Sarcophilus harrisii]|uniref:ly-6/neurotoxin-like protein 1 n=1 Tax=Sarcophilus harrisii TaxID=9305 RepID=UPI0002271ECF|nr:ly-6/neurotoxin-like protein 1 [Sarcophilus harrisii]